MKGLSSIESDWLSKYSRESWRYDETTNKVNVHGNISITDSEIKVLPFHFGRVDGIFKCSNCISLSSVEGMPEDTRMMYFENCKFPEWWYKDAITNKLTIEEFIDQNFIPLYEEYKDFVEEYPEIVEKHRGFIKTQKFGI